MKIEKLLFWLEKRYNVLLEGKHGVGKTSIVLEAFERAGLRWAYFSGSTLDPFIDFCGVPIKIDSDSGSYIELIRPKHIAEGDIQAIFIDEYNRCITGDTKIPLADGTTPTVKELVGRKHFYVYSYDLENSRVCIEKGHSARVTIKNANIIEVFFDNGKSIRCTADHPFLTWSGEYKQAQHLTSEDSLVPFETQISHNQNNPSLNGYHQVWNPTSNEWVFSYLLADEYNVRNNIYEKNEDVCYHINSNKLDNSPENISRTGQKQAKKLSIGQFDQIDQKSIHRKRNMAISALFARRYFKEDFTQTQYSEAVKSSLAPKGILQLQKIKQYFGSFDNFLKSVKICNHRVVKIVKLGREDVYDLTVDRTHNFATDAGVFIHNTHKKIRNAVMELIQFKTINRQPISSDLRVVWAAINPDSDEENTYDTDRLDPAQRDRFHIHVSLPYACDYNYFAQVYGEITAKSALEWWNDLPEVEKNKISPRRLDYALKVWKDGGDIRDVVPHTSNPSRLVSILNIGPAEMQLNKLMGNDNEARAFFAVENNYSYVISTLISHVRFMSAFLHLLPKEKIHTLYVSEQKVKQFILNDIKKSKSNSHFVKTLIEMAQANQNTTLAKQIKTELDKSGVVIVPKEIGVYYYKNVTTQASAIEALAANALNISYQQTYHRIHTYRKLEVLVGEYMDVGTAKTILKICDGLCSCQHRTLLTSLPALHKITNHTIMCLLQAMSVSDVEQLIKPLKKLRRRRADASMPSVNEIAYYLDSQKKLIKSV